MNTLRIITASLLLSCLFYSCSTSRNPTAEGKRKRNKITTISPDIKNPSRSVINASGDGLTPGINQPRPAGSRSNASNIASNAIGRANIIAKEKSQDLESLTDAELINLMAVAQQMEINMSNKMARVSTKDKVKDYTSMIAGDHADILKELKKLASNKNVILEKEIILVGTPKTDLDFIKIMTESNRKLVNLYVVASNSNSSELREFSLKQLPILKKHLETAQEMSKELKSKL
ncbi:DUF4142 domain-containing protein [Pedobacter gandavensis]|uniref:DUF4142 domain-containing protein n=1 Tax=Pedobacter gandavensis TaxID=2679963 RepID=UPI00292E6B58|nr:DUF4142 domain-containing protein [Pedobacter gandavensis]